MNELSKLIESEVADFFAGFGGPDEPSIQSGEAQRQLTERLLSVLALRERDKQEPAIHRYRRVSVEPYGPYPWRYEDFVKYPKPTEGIEDEYFFSWPPAPVVPDDYFASLVTAARARADKAMRKFPQPNYVLNKVAEESGEVIKAVIHYTEGREEWAAVEGEIIDNLAMLVRLVQEGDQVIGFTPPEDCRAATLAAPGKEG